MKKVKIDDREEREKGRKKGRERCKILPKGGIRLLVVKIIIGQGVHII